MPASNQHFCWTKTDAQYLRPREKSSGYEAKEMVGIDLVSISKGQVWWLIILRAILWIILDSHVQNMSKTQQNLTSERVFSVVIPLSTAICSKQVSPPIGSN